jgi:hypothetical protein
VKRREFLLGSAGTIGIVTPHLLLGATPCPPPAVRANSGSPMPTNCPDPNSTLAQACASLGSNQSVEFPSGANTGFNEAEISWETAFYHDDVNGLCQLMAKPANADRAWSHAYYTLATGTWARGGSGMWDNSGHIYGNFTMDFTTGDVFVSRATQGSDAPRRLRWYKRVQGNWNSVAPVNQDIYSGAMENHANGIGYHPNLYGPGDGGAIWNEQANVHFWRKSTDGRESVGYAYGTYGEKEGANCYHPGLNAVFVGGSNGGDLMRVTPNSSAGGRPVVTNMGRPPISTGGHSHESGSNFGSLHVHPGNPSKLMIVETAGSRVYTSTNGSTWTQAGNHPFGKTPRVVCSLRGGLGCLWAVGHNGSAFSTLWKPPV